MSAPSAPRRTCRGAATTRTPASRSSAARPTASDQDDGLGARYQAATPGYFEAIGTRLVTRPPVRSPARDVTGQPFTADRQRGAGAPLLPGRAARSARRSTCSAQKRADRRRRRRRQGQPGRSRRPSRACGSRSARWSSARSPSPSAAPASSPLSLTSAVTAAVHAVDPELPLADIRTLEARAAAALGGPPLRAVAVPGVRGARAGCSRPAASTACWPTSSGSGARSSASASALGASRAGPRPDGAGRRPEDGVAPARSAACC